MKRGTWERLANWQHGNAALLLVVALLLAGGSYFLVRELGLNSAWTALLPEDKPSVRDLEQVGDRLGGLSTLTLAVQSDDVEAMQRFAQDLVPHLEELGEPVQSVDSNVSSYEEFVFEHKHLYADLSDLTEVRDALEERLEFERARANPFYVQLDDEEPADPQELVGRLRSKAEEGRSRMARFPGGFYVHPDGDLLALFLRTNIRGGDVKTAQELITRVDDEVRALGPQTYADDLVVEYAGDLLHAREEHDAIERELVVATSITIALVLLAILIFFRRFRSIVLIGFSLGVPVMVTFAFAELAVDSLNTSTAFLGSIVVGNGINPQIIWLARYFELRRRGTEVRAAIVETHQTTWVATLTASLAAALAYGSLIITDFRGFQDFGTIGGVGMVLCWLGAFAFLPAVVTLSERIKPLFDGAEEGKRGVYGLLFSRAAFGAPRSIVVLALVATLGGSGLIVMAVRADPIEYDFRNLKSVREESSRASQLNGRIKEIVGGAGVGQGIAIVVDDHGDVPIVRDQLERMRDDGDGPYGRVRTVDNLLPTDQADKIPVLEEIRDLLEDARDYADDEQRAEIDANQVPDDLRPLTAADLPEAVARPFRERDGTRGRILFVEQREGESIWDGRYLVAWAASLRTLRAADGTRPPLAGRAPVFADMIEVIWLDGPKAIGASFVATLLLIVFAFRKGRQRMLTMGALLVGIVWMAGAMAALGMKLNFLNFVAFPITFGNGVDYGVNLMRRYGIETDRGATVVDAVRRSIEETGGAVVLCSLTTIIGYISLYTSANRALNSFGSAMAISEVTCVLAAVLAMPAMLLILARRKAASPES